MRRRYQDELDDFDPSDERLKEYRDFGVTPREKSIVIPAMSRDTPEDLRALTLAIQNFKRVWYPFDGYEEAMRDPRVEAAMRKWCGG